MAFLAALPEILGAVGEAGGAEAAAGGAAAAGGEGAAAAGGGGIVSDFNDAPVGKTLGSSFGQKVMSKVGQGALFREGENLVGGGAQQQSGGGGGGPSTGGVNIGPMGNI